MPQKKQVYLDIFLIIFQVIIVGKKIHSGLLIKKKNNNPIWPKTVLQEREKLKEIKLKYITYYESIVNVVLDTL